MSVKKTLKKIVPQILRNYFHLGQSTFFNLRYGLPARKLKVIGVTGTDGKTTTSNLIYYLLKSAGYNTSLISSINAVIGSKKYDTGFHVTTPDPWDVPRYLHQAVREGTQYLVLETTSIALDQFRVAGIPYALGVLTNITPEHLDYHKNFDRYVRAKLKLLNKSQLGIVNVNDSAYSKVSKLLSRPFLRYGIDTTADIQALSVQNTKDGTTFVLKFNSTAIRNFREHKQMTKAKWETVEIISPLFGAYNVSNLLAAISACLYLGLTKEQIASTSARFPREMITGRLEEIATGKSFRVIIDFAHTPNAFAEVLPVVKAQAPQGRLIHVFGAAGLRDFYKRPMMGEISAKYADISVITAEDPRTEKVEEIIKQIAVGAEKSGMKKITKGKPVSAKSYVIIPDRQEAITYAITKIAKAHDVVILTGKGHEKSMCYGNVETPWSEHEVVQKVLKALR